MSPIPSFFPPSDDPTLKEELFLLPDRHPGERWFLHSLFRRIGEEESVRFIRNSTDITVKFPATASL